ncbi:MAG TPA: hypothetical protein VLN26_08785 [Gaiellaceae bacterium]|nr:hypothetical protein [Gaiellaceae bacterium]
MLACVALAFALGGTGYAAVNALPRNSVTTVQVKDHSLLAKDFKSGQLPRGPAGPAGPEGPAGPAGPAGPGGSGVAVKWALLNPNGSIAAQSGGITVTAHATGQTVLDFGAASQAKLIEASAGFANDGAARGTVVAGPCGGTAEGIACPSGNDTSHVIVRTYNAANSALADHAVYVAVFG